MGLEGNSHIVHLVDMGLVKRVFDPDTLTHIPYCSGKSLTGTASYASVHAHQGEELSRRDDLEALGYVLIYMLNGHLMWQNMNSNSKSDKYQQIKRMKQTISMEELTISCPREFLHYMRYCRNLQFEQKPDYDYLRGLFETVAKRENFNLHDQMYDWGMKAVAIQNFPTFFNFH